MTTTQLADRHAALGATMTDFGGWDMPLKYGSDLAEHAAVRESAGLFDLSHMGEIRVTGADVAAFLDAALAGWMSKVAVGRAKYSMLLAEDGGIVDDLITYRLGDAEFLVVPNASNAAAVLAALRDRAAGFDVSIVDETLDTALVAVQGPRSEELVVAQVDPSEAAGVGELKYYAALPVHVGGVPALLARTGYTGEDGFEIYVPNASAGAVWDLFAPDATPAGLAARDSLRLEAAMPLYGHELSRELTPADAGLGMIVPSKKDVDFVGRAALADRPARFALIGLQGEGRRAARAGYAVQVDGATTGEITSGLLSPTLGYPIALARVEQPAPEIGSTVDVDLRGKPTPFTVVTTPFYQRAKDNA